MSWAEALRAGLADGRIDGLPYAATLGVHYRREGDGLVLVLPYADSLIGAPARLHGGAVAGLLELTAIATLVLALPAGGPLPALKPVTVTVDFLREGAMRDTHAAATVVKLGRRVAVLGAEAWQERPDKPIAAARMTVLLG